MKARELFEQAAAARDWGGVCGLAYMHLGGLGGCPVDVEHARKLYQRAIDAGDVRGNVGMGWLHIA